MYIIKKLSNKEYLVNFNKGEYSTSKNQNQAKLFNSYQTAKKLMRVINNPDFKIIPY